MFRYNFTVLLTAGCTVGVLVALYIIFRSVTPPHYPPLTVCVARAYRLLFITYCVSLTAQTEEGGQGVSGDRTGLRLPVRVARMRRTHHGKTDSPPPPYDSPPPYHVAVVMTTEEVVLSPTPPAPQTSPSPPSPPSPPPYQQISESIYI